MAEQVAVRSARSGGKIAKLASYRRARRSEPSSGAAVLLRDSLAASRAARLRHVTPDEPGFARIKKGAGFVYADARGARLKDPKELERIRKLAIPPAWKSVWICRHGNGHLQATGIDARGRKQYRYHSRWREVRDEAKYHDILHFAERLPLLRKRVSRDLASTELTRAKVVATVLRIMERTAIRVGNDRYSETNGSYGLTTLLDRHAKISGGTVNFRFKGKGGKVWNTTIHDERLARIVKRCRDIPGQRLFQYVDADGRFRGITSTDVNEYIQEATSHPFTAKEFRTWTATVSAMSLLYGYPPCLSKTDGKRQILRAAAEVAKELGNTRAICKKSYIHPTVFDSYLAGTLHGLYARCSRGKPQQGLRADECAVLAFFRQFERGLTQLAS
jgi:DNA topoisomerase-1